MITPSLDQITPEPLPRPPEWISTVERRSCSAISPNPFTGMSFASALPLAHNQVRLLNCPTADELQCERLADSSAVQLRMDVLKPRNRAAAKGDEDVTDDDSSLVCWTFRFDF